MGVLGGVAAIAAVALLMHVMSSSGKEEEEVELPEAERDENGMIKWEQFSVYLKTAQEKGKKIFGSKKEEKLVERRQALKDGNTEEFERIALEMVKEEEVIINV